MRVRSILAVLLVAHGGLLLAATPTLYSDPTHESPVRADPDDLLLLPGDGLSGSDKVVYQLIRDTTQAPGHPLLSAVPAAPTTQLGFAEVVSFTDLPASLTIRLPAVIPAGASYALWVVDSRGVWSNAVRVNDARPLWISPAYGYATQPVANLPRVLKVIGRNLQPTASGATRVRLSGPRVYSLVAQRQSNSSLARHVAQVALPAAMEPGRYAVEVSRDGVSWVGLLGKQAPTYEVLADSVPVPTVKVGEYDCESEEDTSCVVSAIAAASDIGKYPNGATVVFDARTYRLSDPGTWPASGDESDKRVDFEGIRVPQRVNLQGQGMGLTVVERGKGWVTPRISTAAGQPAPLTSLFNLQGRNVVSGFTFSDANEYTATSSHGHAALSLGITAGRARNSAPAQRRLSNVIITRNEFKLPFVGVLGQGLPIDHLFITYNTVAAYENGIYINRRGSTEADNPFDLTDSVVSFNEFHPSSHDAVIASQLGGGTRLDFSDNFADGTSTRYLYDAADRKGFRAAFFWNLSSNSELKLVSRNRILCSGDKPGDGEAIVFDGDDERAYGGFDRTASVTAARRDGPDSSTVTVDGPPRIGPLGFVGQWLQVVHGPGLGQLRKITAWQSDARTATFTVSPAFDVLPRGGSELTVGLQNWQSYIVDNLVDHSSSVCVNGVKRERTAGAILFYAQTADSVIDGNRQIATTGIGLAHQYRLAPGEPAFLMLQSSNEVRDNLVDAAPRFGELRGNSGIRAFYVASREASLSPSPPVLGFGAVIAGNRLDDADDANGAIGFEDGGPVGFLNARGGCAAQWKLAALPLVFHNELHGSRGIDINAREVRQNPVSCPSTIRDSIVWRATLYNNSCSASGKTLLDFGTETRAVCPPRAANSCECR